MPNSASCFTLFSQNIDALALPEKFTFPFYYEPQPLAVAATKQLQQQLETLTHLKAENAGKMFGVLVVQNAKQQLGFLSAYSGQIEGDKGNISFVPPVSSMQLQDDTYLAQSKIINDINAQIEQLENSEQLLEVNNKLDDATQSYQQALLAQQAVMQAGRQQRKIQRTEGELELSESDFEQLKNKLAGQSIVEKKQLLALKAYWQNIIESLQQTHINISDEIAHLKKRRKTLSKSLQKKLFAQYQFLNANGETTDLNAIFAALPEHTPPSGAGDCAAPKLLQYAYKHDLKPLAMAEFWWGAAPKSAIRQHKNYYPSCYSKCQPILGHMLKGLDVEDNPLLTNPAQGKDLSIVYKDDDLLVVNKPAEFLSVPGVNIDDSVYMRIKTQFPEASGPLIVHRLDMSTSGLLMIALNKRVHKALQKQFIERTIDKRYVALVNGNVAEDSGVIDLPLVLDFDDKPRQMVCYTHGKPSLTTWQVLERNNNITRLQLYPKTGRTHQLRVHCAHSLGLNMPIIGDTHYGQKADRLHLHAEYLAFTHPITLKRLEFEVAADF
ncbi:RNA pseudouridine synthase [Pseudoalteromonas sp. SR43-6]|uniref:RluA family pseudouridine synthase n=1 Tax=unclassified Pseudoalteromonas TaxID=194690 RepID=UPI0015FE5352|nr:MULTISPECIES: RluA family pseudouridine synthase [unclassified Pseudoalteromonas]MBB1288211.1 RNA pseudouridine synthase [Pseudoalteromonas sp. SR41-5]MBB1374350.1 RNA pseudouridine synthase [Pseudoalteromonas sp. SR43-6]MBB1413453.1 RNA pseudouridine synthase [Pseudoalteromonas sp. SG43-8]